MKLKALNSQFLLVELGEVPTRRPKWAVYLSSESGPVWTGVELFKKSGSMAISEASREKRGNIAINMSGGLK